MNKSLGTHNLPRPNYGETENLNRSIMSPPGSSIQGIFQARILDCIAISWSRGIFPTQGLNLGLLHCRPAFYHLSHQGSPMSKENGSIIKSPKKEASSTRLLH